MSSTTLPPQPISPPIFDEDEKTVCALCGKTEPCNCLKVKYNEQRYERKQTNTKAI